MKCTKTTRDGFSPFALAIEVGVENICVANCGVGFWYFRLKLAETTFLDMLYCMTGFNLSLDKQNRKKKKLTPKKRDKFFP